MSICGQHGRGISASLKEMRERDDVSEGDGWCVPMPDDWPVRAEGVQLRVELRMHNSGVARVVLQPGFVQDKVHAIRAEVSQE